MKIAIIGSRNLDFDLTPYLLRFNKIDLIITGGAKGIDTCAENYANKRNIPVKIIKPNYEKMGKNAPLIRNIEIVNEADYIVAFWDGESKGTKFTLKEAKRQNKDILVFTNKDAGELYKQISFDD